MKKNIIIDLDGIIFEPIGDKFAITAREQYGATRGNAICMAYKYNIGRNIFARQINDIITKCASNPTVIPGAMDALEKLVSMKNIRVEFCSQFAAPTTARALEEQYRAMSPAMDAVAHYELISPLRSKRQYIIESTGRDGISQNFILDSNMKNLEWPARWHIVPVLISPNALRQQPVAKRFYGARAFDSLAAFQEFLMHRQR